MIKNYTNTNLLVYILFFINNLKQNGFITYEKYLDK